jgi:arylsulfatase A
MRVSYKIVGLLVVFVCLVLGGVDLAEAGKPNFIFVLSDDIAQGDLGCYGQQLIKTPNLDRMAREGTRFMQAYCGTSVCAPSRSSFFTGLHVGHCPVRGNYEVPPEGQLPLPDKTVTIAEVAKAANYATATFGKWGMGYFDSSGSPHKQGVDHFFGYNCQRHAHSYFPTYLYDDAQPFLLPGNDGQKVGKTYAQELIQNDMINWLKANADKPFMMFYAITLPHGRFEIDDQGIYKDKPWSDKEKNYAAMVSRLDSDVGELLDTLRKLGIEKNTLVLFSGDNGSSFSPKSEIGKRFNQARNGLRGFKRGMYEGALRQAALAWWPGTVPAGRVDDQPWAFWDLMPTFVEMSGAKPPKDYETDGFSLLEYLKGGLVPKRDYFYWELHNSNRPVQAARFGKYKAVRNGIDKPVEIYDLSKDSAESKNLADAHPELVKKSLEIFSQAHRPDPNWPLDRRSKKHIESSKEAWKIKRWRDQNQWVPENAVKCLLLKNSLGRRARPDPFRAVCYGLAPNGKSSTRQ